MNRIKWYLTDGMPDIARVIVLLTILLVALLSLYAIYYFALYKLIIWLVGVIHHAWINSGGQK